MPPDPPSARNPADEALDTGLPRSIFVPQEDPNRELREAVDAVLSDSFMGFLAALLVPIILLPFFVNFPPTIQAILDVGDVTIVLFFIAEYFAKLYLAVDRRAFVRSPWHLLDLAVILLSVVSYLPLAGLSGKGSAILLLRLLRLPRLFAVGGRTVASRLVHDPAGQAPPPAPPAVVLRQIDPAHPGEPRPLSWAELEAHLASRDAEWIHIGNASEAEVVRLGALLRLPGPNLRLQQVDDLWPQITRLERTVLLFLQAGEIVYPRRTRDFFTVARRGSVIVLQGPKVLSISPHGTDPFPRVLEHLRESSGSASLWNVQVVEGLLDLQLRDFRALLNEVELEIRGIGRTPRSKLPKDFLSRIYELNKSIARLASNISHYREVLNRLVSGRIPFEGLSDADRSRLEMQADEANYLMETARDATENLKTIIDVYINQSSFETNRILKILAVITAVSIIPATIGGLLGIDGPYDFVLWEVLLSVLVSMLFVAYCFVKLGWLRA